jgi:predicted permease
VVVQVALALVLLVGSGLMIRTFQALRNVHPGFVKPDAVQIVRVSAPGEPEAVIRAQQAIADKLQALPGVESVGVSNSVMLDPNRSTDPIYAEDHTYQEDEIAPLRRYRWVGPGYFKTLGAPLLAGRELEWADVLNRRKVVLISQNLAKEYWGDPAAAIGKRVRERPQGEWREIIGVMADEYGDGVDKPAPTVAYWPMLVEKIWTDDVQVRRSTAFTLRSDRAGQEAFLREVRAAIWSVNGNLPVSGEETLGFLYRRSMARTSFTLVMLGIASAMALLLGMIGIYGVISYSVSQRTREIGIRIALGAREAELKTMFVRHGLLLAGIGAACGLIAAAVLMRVLSGLLFGVQPMDPMTYSAVTAGLLGVAMVASYLPARRATTVDPVEALRSE